MIPGASIRLATPAEAESIARMSRVLIERGLPWSWNPQRVAAAIRNTSTNVAVAWLDKAGAAGSNEVVLGFGIMKYSESAAHLLLLAVRADRQRHGLGSALVDWLEEVARTAGIETVYAEARADNVAALALYRKRGYRERALVPGMYSGMDDGVRLEKSFCRPKP